MVESTEAGKISVLGGAASSGLPVPFTEKEMLEELEDVLFERCRVMGHIANPSVPWAMLGRTPAKGMEEVEICNWELGRQDCGLEPGAFRSWQIYGHMADLYQFAFFGVSRQTLQGYHRDCEYTWVAAYIADCARSETMLELEGSGAIGSSAEKCLHVVMLANARALLEAGEVFSYFASIDRDTSGLGALSIAQLALLAGVEPTTVRSVISRGKDAEGALRTIKEDGRTLVPLAEAKEWLKARGRYVPFVYRPNGGDADLGQTRFEDSLDLYDYIGARYRHLGLSTEAFRQRVGNAYCAQVSEAAAATEPATPLDAQGWLRRDFLGIEDGSGSVDERLARAVGVALEVDAQLMLLRIQQTALHEQIAATERRIRQVVEERGRSAAAADGG